MHRERVVGEIRRDRRIPADCRQGFGELRRLSSDQIGITLFAECGQRGPLQAETVLPVRLERLFLVFIQPFDGAVQVFDGAVFPDQPHRRVRPDPRHALDVVAAVPHQALQGGNLRRCDAKLRLHPCGVEGECLLRDTGVLPADTVFVKQLLGLLLRRLHHPQLGAVGDQLQIIVVPGHQPDRNLAFKPGCRAPAEVIRLKFPGTQLGDRQLGQDLLAETELLLQRRQRLLAVCLVGRIHLPAEGFPRQIPCDSQILRFLRPEDGCQRPEESEDSVGVDAAGGHHDFVVVLFLFLRRLRKENLPRKISVKLCRQQ